MGGNVDGSTQAEAGGNTGGCVVAGAAGPPASTTGAALGFGAVAGVPGKGGATVAPAPGKKGATVGPVEGVTPVVATGTEVVGGERGVVSVGVGPGSGVSVGR